MRGIHKSQSEESTSTILIETKYGTLRGLTKDGTQVFKGISYGRNTGGLARFTPPREPEPWFGVKDAIEFGAPAVQNTAQRSRMFHWLQTTQKGSEDCLVLNVFAPLEVRNQPVLVYFHGGAFSFGSSDVPVLDGSQLSRHGDVVVVTINHRLNIFGHLCSYGTSDSSFDDSANVGILDLVAALTWVRDNIEAFGGDPDNVTLFGQSGGATKIALLMRTKAAQGLFKRAIIQSTASGSSAQSVDEALRATHCVLKHFDIPLHRFADLQHLSADKLLAAVKLVTNKNQSHDYFRPINDERTLMTCPQGVPITDIPVLIGYTDTEASYYMALDDRNSKLSRYDIVRRLKAFTKFSDEDVLELINQYALIFPDFNSAGLLTQISGDYMFKAPTIKFAEELSKVNRAPVYMYKFALRPNSKDPTIGSPHTGELPFVFGNISVAPEYVEDVEVNTRVMHEMMSTWVNFARYGRPSAPRLSDWTPFNTTKRSSMVFDHCTQLFNDPDKSVRELLSNKPPYVPGAAMNFWHD